MLYMFKPLRTFNMLGLCTQYAFTLCLTPAGERSFSKKVKTTFPQGFSNTRQHNRRAVTQKLLASHYRFVRVSLRVTQILR